MGKGIRFDLGKMVTYFGAEVIEAIDNPNYSRSFLFNYAIPFTHTGLKMSYAFTDALSASFHIVNGWDNSTDNNRGKCYGTSISFTPAEVFALTVNGMTGPEQDEQGVGDRSGRGDDDGAVDQGAGQPRKGAALPADLVVLEVPRVGQQLVAGSLDRARDALEQLGGERLELGHEDADDVGAVADGGCWRPARIRSPDRTRCPSPCRTSPARRRTGR